MIIRWVCDSCKKKYIYPVKKCVHCKSQDISKQKTTEAKIIGKTKVSIPSPTHPIIPYSILLLEDEHGNRMPKKTMKDYEIGSTFSFEKKTKDPCVSISKVKYDIREAISQCCDLVDASFSKDDKVVVKVSCIEPAYSYQAVNTNPETLDSLLAYLKESGVSDVVVAEQALPGNDTLASMKKAGLLTVCKKHDVEFVDISKTEFVEKEHDGKTFEIAKIALERKIINLPTFKTHGALGMSGALLSLTRFMSNASQHVMFIEGIDTTIRHVVSVIPEGFHILDATNGLQGQGPTSLGSPAFLNVVLGSSDAVALDTVSASMADLSTPSYVVHAQDDEKKNALLANIEVVGDELDATRMPIEEAKQVARAHPYITLVNGEATPALFSNAMKMCARLHGVSGHPITLVIGGHVTRDMIPEHSRVVVYGDDAIDAMKKLEFSDFIKIESAGDAMEKLLLLKSILEDPTKKRITGIDKVKSKMAKLGAGIKAKIS